MNGYRRRIVRRHLRHAWWFLRGQSSPITYRTIPRIVVRPDSRFVYSVDEGLNVRIDMVPLRRDSPPTGAD